MSMHACTLVLYLFTHTQILSHTCRRSSSKQSPYLRLGVWVGLSLSTSYLPHTPYIYIITLIYSTRNHDVTFLVIIWCAFFTTYVNSLYAPYIFREDHAHNTVVFATWLDKSLNVAGFGLSFVWLSSVAKCKICCKDIMFLNYI